MSESDGVLEVLPYEVPSLAPVSRDEYLSDVPLRDEVLASVGMILYLAASPDEYDGLSDRDFQSLKDHGPGVFSLYEKLGKLGVAENFRLPDGFSEHFRDEVVPDLEIIRSDPAKREAFRREVRAILHDPAKVKSLYREGGITYSEILSKIAESGRTGRFYQTGAKLSRRQRTNSRRVPALITRSAEEGMQ
jgi:hypothetical protein